jgi:hypothetical protein
MEINSYEQKILNMRKKDNCFILTILNEAIKWNPFLDKIIVLCDVLRILDKNNLAVSRNEVRKAFNKYYGRDYHFDKISYLNWIYKKFHIKENTRVFIPQVRKNNASPQTSGHKTPLNSHDFNPNVPEVTKDTSFSISKGKTPIIQQTLEVAKK